VPEPTSTNRVAHGRQRLSGRDPDEAHRAATPLELLFDLTFVVAFGIAANELAHYVADGHAWTGIAGFAFACFAVSWAWINYSWFASAYDTDDWVMRLATLVMMVGVLVLALGLEQAFASIDHGDVLDNGVMVAGYVVMRVPMVFLWARVARDDRPRRPAALTYIWTISVAQVFWVVLAIIDLPIGTTFAIAAVLIGVELTGPIVAQYRKGGTPWHAGHIAERYGLLVIITLGEGILGTVAAINALVHGSNGWTVDAAVVASAGVALIFATWWTYFVLPWADVLRLHPERGFIFGYGHIMIFASLAAIGAGLHVAALFLQHDTTIGETATVAATTIPVAVYLAALYGIYAAFTRHLDRFHLWLLAGTAGVLVLSVALAAVGVGVDVCLAVLVLAPVVTVLGYETLGHRHVAEALGRMGVGFSDSRGSYYQRVPFGEHAAWFAFMSDRFDHSSQLPEEANAGNQFYGRDVAVFITDGLAERAFDASFLDEDWGWQAHAKRQDGAVLEISIYHNPDEDRAAEDNWALMLRSLRKERKLGLTRFSEVEIDDEAISAIEEIFRRDGIELRRTERD
jgi:low temperature requirement protein LtrA